MESSGDRIAEAQFTGQTPASIGLITRETEPSTDGGKTWAKGEFIDPIHRYAWRRWTFNWVTPKEPGRYTLMSRARAANGEVRPDKHDENHGGYVINHVLPIEVTVR